MFFSKKKLVKSNNYNNYNIIYSNNYNIIYSNNYNANFISRIPHTDETDTQGCGVGLADVKLSSFIDITLFDTQT